ncbi:hypothetical protein ACVDFE_04190 [Lentzea chajnantorensis]
MKILATAALLGGLLAPAQAEETVSCQAPDPFDMRVQEHYDFALLYKTQCASKQNWDRTFADVTIATDRVSVTASTALAGAIASVRHGGREYIGSGGHGSALQWAVRPSVAKLGQSDGRPHTTECYNPTQAGSQKDDHDEPPPFHGPSTSALTRFEKTGPTSYAAASRLAMYVPLGERSKFDSCDPAHYQDPAPVAGEAVNPMPLGLSRYWLNPDVDVRDNVIRLGAGLHVEDAEPAAHLGEVYTTVVAYTLKDFTRQYTYVDGGAVPFVDDWDHKNRPLLRCTEGGEHCLGLYWQRSRFPQGTAYAYQASVEPNEYTAWGGSYTVEVTFKTTGQRHAALEAYAAVGTQQEVIATLDRLSRELP